MPESKDHFMSLNLLLDNFDVLLIIYDAHLGCKVHLFQRSKKIFQPDAWKFSKVYDFFRQL
jgi:hypothetical protein